MLAFRRSFAIMSAFAAVGSVAVPAAHSQQSSAVMEVTATVTDSCSVSASPMRFRMEKAAGSADFAQASVNLECNGAVAYQIALDEGSNARDHKRRMVDPDIGSALMYDIYSDPAHSARWGSRIGINTVSAQLDHAGTASHTAYGAIAAIDTESPAGTFADSVVVTLSF